MKRFSSHTRVARFMHGLGHKDSFVLVINNDMPYYTGEKLSNIIALLTKSIAIDHGSEECTSSSSKAPLRILMYADTLDAYNKMLYDPLLSLDEARIIATEEGDKWLASEDAQRLQRDIPWTCAGERGEVVVRWAQLLALPEYLDAKRIIDGLYKVRAERRDLKALAKQGNKDAETQLLFSERVDTLVGQKVGKIQAELQRHPLESFSLVPEEAANCIREYLKEECAMEIVLAQKYGPKYILYPGDVNAAMATIHDKIIRPLHPGLMQWNKITIPETQDVALSGTDTPKSSKVLRKISSHASTPIHRHENSAISSLGMFSTQVGPNKEISSYSTNIEIENLDINRLFCLFGQYTVEINRRAAKIHHALFNTLEAQKTGKKLTSQDMQELLYACEVLESLEVEKKATFLKG